MYYQFHMQIKISLMSQTLKLFPFAWLSSIVNAGMEIEHTAGKKLSNIINKCSIFAEKTNFAQAMKMY